MDFRRCLLVLIALFGHAWAATAQYGKGPLSLADDLCACIGSIDPGANDNDFKLAVRHCLNTTIMGHPHEVIGLLSRYPAMDRNVYLLGLLLGETLDRTCPQYPLLKGRLRTLQLSGAASNPST